MPKILLNISKVAIFLLLYLVLPTGCFCAENPAETTQNLNGLPDYALPEYLKNRPETFMEEMKEEETELEKCEKPDICGEIIFDPTVWEVPLTLDEALAIALDKNFDIKEFLARKNRFKWFFYQAAAGLLPDITYDFRLGYLQGQFLADFIIPDRVSEFPLESNFLYSHNISARKWFIFKESFYIFESARKELDFTRDEALLEAARAYYELLRAKVDIKILEINVKQIEEQFRINKQRVAAGAGSQFDVYRAEADRDRAIQRLLRRRNSYRLAQAQLSNVLGLPVFIQLVPCEQDIFIKEIFADCFTLETAGQIAICERDDLAALKMDIKAARQRKNQGYSVYLPEINIRGQVAQQGTVKAGIFPNTRIELFVDWNGLRSLGLFGYTEIKAREAEIMEEKFQYTIQCRNIQENVLRAFSDVITERQLIEVTAAELEAAGKSREISLIRLKEEIGSFIDVIQTQSVYTDARANYLESITNYNISQIELLFEMGVISINSILNGFRCGVYEQNYNLQKEMEFNIKLMKELKDLEKTNHSGQLHEKFYKDETQTDK